MYSYRQKIYLFEKKDIAEGSVFVAGNLKMQVSAE